MQSSNNESFKYKVIIRLSHAPECSLKEELNTVADISLTSKLFDSYLECADSGTCLIDSFLAELNKSKTLFRRVIEISPLHGGKTPVLSVDWEEHEISRIWIYSCDEDKNAVKQAIAQLSIMLAYNEEPVKQLN